MTNPPPNKDRKEKANSDKLKRRISIVRKLQKNQGRSCDDWSIHYGVVKEQIYRDIRELRRQGWPIVNNSEGRYVFAKGLDAKKHIGLLKALVPGVLDNDVFKLYLQALDSRLLTELRAYIEYIQDTRSGEDQSPGLMTFASLESIAVRHPPTLSPDMQDQLSFLIEPLSQMDDADRKSLFDSLTP